MMDTTTSRAEFEAWLKSKMPTTYRLAFECSDDDELTNLAKASVLDMRTAWQASRDSLVVELPKSGFYLGYESPEYMEKDDVIENLRDAGIRIKGESE